MKWMVSMKRYKDEEKQLNKCVVDADTEYQAMFAAETLHGDKGWMSTNARPAVLMSKQEADAAFPPEVTQ